MPWTETDADGTTTTYDDLGRLLRFEYSSGAVMSFSHHPDDTQTMTILALADGTVAREILDLELNAVATVASGFTYDASGRVLTETRLTTSRAGEVVDTETATFTYDDDGQVLTLEETDAAGTTTVKVANAYDGTGKLTSRITRAYDADGTQIQAVRSLDDAEVNGPTEKWRLAGTPWLPGATMSLRKMPPRGVGR